MARIKFRVSGGSHAENAPPSRAAVPMPEVPICCERGRTLSLLQTSAPCGCDRRIFACPHKGQCVQIDPEKAAARSLVAEARERGLQICAECELFESLSESGPS